MKKPKKLTVNRLCLGLGIALLVIASVVLICWQVGIHTAQGQADAYVTTLRTLLPTPRSAAPEARLDNSMPVLAVDGADFVGILEMPQYGSAQPVGAAWGQISKYPCCFSGSVYDRSLQIGGSSQQGQYDFYREISVGDTVYFTDMEGNRFQYAVTDIRYESHADQAALGQQEAALTLFIKNVYAMEYILIFCDTAS